MKIVAFLVICAIITFSVATRTDCNSETNVLSVGDTSSRDVCDEKKVCTLECQCGKIAFFDITSTQYERQYQRNCSAPKLKAAFGVISRIIDAEEYKDTYPKMEKFSASIKSLIVKGLTSLSRLQRSLNEFKSIENIEGEEHGRKILGAMEMLVVNVAGIFAKKCSCDDFVSGVSKGFRVKQCRRVCGGKSETPEDPEDDGDEEPEPPKPEPEPEQPEEEKEDEKERDDEDDDDDEEEDKPRKRTPRRQPKKPTKRPRKPKKPTKKPKKPTKKPKKPTKKPTKKPKKPKKPTKSSGSKPRIPEEPIKVVPPIEIPEPVFEPAPVPSPQPEQEIHNIRTEIKILIPQFKQCVQKRTQCCADKNPCCNESLRHSSGKTYQDLFRRLARRTRKTLRAIARRNANRRLHERTRSLTRRIFANLSQDLKTKSL